MNKLALYRYLITSGIASRRKCNSAIKEGEVKVNGRVVKDPLFFIDIKKDIVGLKNKIISPDSVLKKDFVYYLLNKPKGFISTVKDTHGRKKVLDLIKHKTRIYPVGRLDKDTEGLLILTNDGKFTYKITHPKFAIDKIYELLVKPIILKKDIIALQRGVVIDKNKKVSANVERIKDDEDKNQSKLRMIIHQGINRQIKKMLAAVNHKVIDLKRVQLGPLKLNNLKSGHYRKLSDKEINLLKKTVGKL